MSIDSYAKAIEHRQVLAREQAEAQRFDRLCKIQEADPHGIDQHTPGAKLDAGKDRVWLCLGGFSRALAEVAKVTAIGATKYTPNGWMEVADGEVRYMDAFGRHMLALGSGEVIDADTGCRHKAQMIWDLLASLELELRK